MATSLTPTGKVSYRQQYRRCGKEGCSRCKPGAPGHGPYWYAAWWADGRMHSRYVGKQLPVGAQAGEAAAVESPPTETPAAANAAPTAQGARRRPTRATLRVRTLGAFAVWVDETPIPPTAWSRRKVVTALFKQLLSAPNARAPREALMESLWPDASPTAAAANLRYTIHLLRKFIDPPGAGASCLSSEGDMLALVPGSPAGAEPWLDAARFALAARQAVGGSSVEACASALSLYHGAYLPDDLYAEWAEARRHELHALRLAVLHKQADLLQQAGDLAAAQRCLVDVLDADPCHEGAARTQMRLQAVGGRRTEALATYRRLAAALERELDTEPEAETRLLYADLLAGRLGRPAEQPRPSEETRPPTVDEGTPAAFLAVQPAIEPLTVQAPNVPLLARAAELATLLAQLAMAADGQTTMVLIHGPAGAGKSRVLSAFLDAARRRGALALVGRAYVSEGQLPYGPLQQALRTYIAAQPVALLAEQAAYHGVLMRLIPELGRLLPNLPSPTPLEPKAERHRLFAAISDLLGALGRQRPVVLVLDDLHWADRTTLQVLHYLLRGGAGRLLIVGSYRSDEVAADGPLDQLRAALRGAAPVTSLALAPLDEGTIAELAGALLTHHPVTPAVLELLAAKTLGNPLYVIELVAALRQAGALQVRDGQWRVDPDATLPISSGMHTIFHDRVRRLGEEATALARLCAVAGQHATYPLVRAVADLPESTLLDALEELIETRVLTELATPDEAGFPAYALVHPLLREAIYQQIPTPRRMYLHRRTAEALEARHTAPERAHAVALSWHFGQAGATDAAAHYAIAAGDQAARALALPEALSDYQAAQAHVARHQGTPLPRYTLPAPGKLDERQGDILLVLGRYDEARARFAAARAAVEDARWRLDLARKEATAWERRGEFAHARAVLDHAEAEASAAGILSDPVRAALLLSYGTLAYQRGEYAEAMDQATVALDLAAGGDDEQLAARIHQLLGNIAVQQQRAASAEHHYRRGLAIWDRHADDPRTPHEVARTWLGLGSASYQRGDYAPAEECFQRALEINERIGSVAGSAAVLNNLGNAAYARGHFAAAETYYRRSLALWEQTGDRYLAGYAWNNLGGVAMAVGDLATAQECYERGLAVQERAGSRTGCGTAWQNLGDVALARGDLALAETLYLRSLELLAGTQGQEAAAGAIIGRASVARLGGHAQDGLALARPARRHARAQQAPATEAAAALEVARCHLASARPRHAAAVHAHARSLVDRHGLALMRIRATLLASEIALLTGETNEAESTAEQARREAGSAGCRIEEARAGYLLGCIALRRGETEHAGARLRQAGQTLRELGCALDAEQCEGAWSGRQV